MKTFNNIIVRAGLCLSVLVCVALFTTGMNAFQLMKKIGYGGGAGLHIPQSLTLSSSGTAYPNIEGEYTIYSTLNSRPWYKNSSGFNIYWTGSQWNVTINGGIQYYSTEDVASPDLVTSWTKGNAATFMTSTGAGNSNLNATWYKSNLADGKYIFRVDYFLYVAWNIGGLWEIQDNSNEYWYSTEDVATPDLVTSWTILGGGTAPPPDFTAPVEAGDITIIE